MSEVLESISLLGNAGGNTGNQTLNATDTSCSDEKKAAACLLLTGLAFLAGGAATIAQHSMQNGLALEGVGIVLTCLTVARKYFSSNEEREPGQQPGAMM